MELRSNRVKCTQQEPVGQRMEPLLAVVHFFFYVFGFLVSFFILPWSVCSDIRDYGELGRWAVGRLRA